ncbi:TPA: hypothetical protein JI043_05715 [Acinetobacter baumannii]|uniref:hypothetical protein n=1 Tax=Acinetobacter calcoaceticus/baumannii complex TaxID=909768 RepID=UPI00124FAD71|nr:MULTISPECIES: hypothetical protein [Acinetobacter calcoaceticus/baumannii complex]NDX80636.1 hypothetical protein [Acinetobacter baumannii]QJG74757.1 hypothetical protein HB663_05730 [Acinetobacter baumannii]HAV5289373.1 hypothetical protein [Acinetobacter baumannii]HAV5304367.1 hypothetical protein [Acinetobacter baumannii]HAV5316356.1 hypothetical protein [Acinetobacter baumannii]
MSFEYINNTYGVNAELGRRVIADGKPGIITGTHNALIVVNLDEDKPGHKTYWHPTWNMQYLGMGKIRKMTAGQKRYQEFLDADWFDGNFAEWLGVDKESKARRESYKKYGY